MIKEEKIAKFITSLEEIKDKLKSMMEDEQDKFDNMPEGLQESECGKAMQEVIGCLEDAACSIDDAINRLNNID